MRKSSKTKDRIFGFTVEEMAARVKDLAQIDLEECRAELSVFFDSKRMALNYVALYRRLLGVQWALSAAPFTDESSWVLWKTI